MRPGDKDDPERFVEGLGGARERRGPQGAAERVLLRGVDRPRWARASRTSSAGASPRARARWSAPSAASSRSPTRGGRGRRRRRTRRTAAAETRRRSRRSRPIDCEWPRTPAVERPRPRPARAAAATRARRDSRAGMALVSPTVIVVIVMVVLPVLWALVLSFQRHPAVGIRRLDLLGGEYTLRNYDLLLSSRASCRRRGRRSCTPCSARSGAIVLGLTAALLVRSSFRGPRARPRRHAPALGGARRRRHLHLAGPALAPARIRQRRRRRPARLDTPIPFLTQERGTITLFGVEHRRADRALDGDRLRVVEVVPVRLPVHPRAAAGGARTSRRRRRRRGHAHAGLPAHHPAAARRA